MLKVDEIKAQDQRAGESQISAISRPLQMSLRLARAWLLGLLSLGCCPGGIMSFIVPSVVSRPCRRSVLPGTLRSTALASPTQAPAPLDFGEDRQGRIRLRYNPRGWNVWQHRPRLSPEAHGANATCAQALRVNYIQHGSSGPALVFVHGFGASAFHWRYQIAALAATHRVFAVDLLGFGLSDKPNITYSNEVWGRQVQAFVNEVVGEPAVLVGNSLGGVVCLQTAALAPAQVRGIVLINTPGNFHDATRAARGSPDALAARWRRLRSQSLAAVVSDAVDKTTRSIAAGSKTLQRRLLALAAATMTTPADAKRVRQGSVTPLWAPGDVGGLPVAGRPPPLASPPQARGGGEKTEGEGAGAGAGAGVMTVTEEEMRSVFDALDADGSGSVDAGELREATRSLGLAMDQVCVDRSIDRQMYIYTHTHT